ncbi:hypothetical protein ACFXDH_08415 [Streptomyces sp. NPDC059467]|uniref:hypothetical protein n=1 Tax=Streptomyces sp. NPDC059467 TaxID=3346844 RepID=UPI0036910956
MRLSREEGLTPGLLDRLTAGHLDLAVVSTTGRTPLEPYELHHLLNKSLCVAVPANHPPGQLRRSGPTRPTRRHRLDLRLLPPLRQVFRPLVTHVVAD